MQNKIMLHMIMFLLVAYLIGFLLFRTISKLKSSQPLNHMVAHYQCIKIMHQKQVLMSGLEQLEQPNLVLSHNDIFYAIRNVNQEPLKWIFQTRNIISFNEEKTHLGVNAKQKLFLFYDMVLINILLMILSYNIIMSCLVRTTCFCLVQIGNLIILRRCLFITCKRKIFVQQEHIDCISDFRVGLTFEVVWFLISRTV